MREQHEHDAIYHHDYLGANKKGIWFIAPVAGLAIIFGIVTLFLTSSGVFSLVGWLAKLIGLNLSSIGVTSLTSIPFAFLSGLFAAIGSGIALIAVGFLLYLGFSFLKSCIEAITSDQQISAIDVVRKIRSFVFSIISLPISLALNILVYPVIGLTYFWNITTDIMSNFVRHGLEPIPILGMIGTFLATLILLPIIPIYYLLKGAFDACFYNAKRGIVHTLNHPFLLFSCFLSTEDDGDDQNETETVIKLMLLGLVFSMVISAVFAILAATHTFSILHYIAQVTNFNPITTFHLIGAPIPTLAIATFGLFTLAGAIIFAPTVLLYMGAITIPTGGIALIILKAHVIILKAHVKISDPDVWRAAGRGIKNATFGAGRAIRDGVYSIGRGCRHLFYLFKYRVLMFEPKSPEESERYTKLMLEAEDLNDPISMKRAETLAITPCKHIYNYTSLLHWLSYSENKSCPICRAPVEAEKVQALPGQWKAFLESRLPQSKEGEQQDKKMDLSEQHGPEPASVD